MRRRPKVESRPDTDPLSDLQRSAAALESEDLRALVLAAAGELGAAALSRLAGEAARRVVARHGKGRFGDAGDASLLREVRSFCASAERRGSAHAEDLDELFARIDRAWLRGEHGVVRQAIESIVELLDDGIDLGQHELYDDVLATDLHGVGTRYLVSVYLSAAEGSRAREMRGAMDQLRGLGTMVAQPLAEMTAIAVEPLPGLDGFAGSWAQLLREELATAGDPEWMRRELEGFLREAVQKKDGAAGLAELARASRRAGDYAAAAKALAEQGSLDSAATVSREGAEAVTDGEDRAVLWTLAARLDVALRRDPADALGRAFGAAPSDVRARRWLAAIAPPKVRAATRRTLPKGKGRYDETASTRALLAAIDGRWEEVAALLRACAPLGWSGPGHAGRLATGAIVWAMTDARCDGDLLSLVGSAFTGGADSLDEPAAWPEEDLAGIEGLPALEAPVPLALLERAKSPRPEGEPAAIALSALRTAAAARFAAVAGDSRRSRYDDAGRLVALAAGLTARAGDAREAARYLDAQRATAGRKWALCAAIDRHAAPLGLRSPTPLRMPARSRWR